ncbi:MAG: ABC transporter substrate-binding protein [Actinomycetota bacterium]
MIDRFQRATLLRAQRRPMSGRPARRLQILLAVAFVASLGPAPGGGAQAPPGSLRLPFPQEDGTLTPYTFELGYPLVTLIYDTLAWRDVSGVARPWLASSIELGDQGTRLTIRLAGRAQWQDGHPVTSEDVAFTFRFVAERYHPRFTPQLSAIQDVSAPDPATVVITLRHAAPGFLDQPLADVPILPKHLWERLSRSQLAPEGLPLGSGPYRLVEHRPGELYRFEANPDYFRGPPALRAIDVPILTDFEATLGAFTRRRVDAIPVSLPRQAVPRVQGFGIRIARGPSYLGTVLVFNLRRPPFDRVEAREAVAGALDLTRIMRAVGDAVPSERGYLHPESAWAPRRALRPSVTPPNAAAAIALNRPIRLLAPNNDPVKLEAGRQVSLALRRAGVSVDLEEVDREELARAIGEDGSPPDFDAAISVAPTLASYDPDFLRVIFGSDAPKAPLNYSGYRSPTFEQLADRIAGTADPEARRQAVEQSLALLAKDLPVAPLFYSQGVFAYRTAIYDRWVFVKGSGILDKRSFVPSSAVRATSAPEQGGDAGRGPRFNFSFGLVALGLAAAAVAVAVAGAVRRSR